MQHLLTPGRREVLGTQHGSVVQGFEDPPHGAPTLAEKVADNTLKAGRSGCSISASDTILATSLANSTDVSRHYVKNNVDVSQCLRLKRCRSAEIVSISKSATKYLSIQPRTGVESTATFVAHA